MKEISDSYKGDCKNGLADGKGTATGEDSYTGTFLYSLPEGKEFINTKTAPHFPGTGKTGLNGKGNLEIWLTAKL